MGRLLVSAAVVLCLVSGIAVQADVAILQPDRDNTLYDDTASGGGGQLSNGQGAAFFAGLAGAGTRRGLVAFDLAGNLPAGATITSAVLTLNVNMTIAGEVPVSLHTTLSDWGEGASNADGQGGGGGGIQAMPGDATWLHTFFDTQFWSQPGGDFVAAPSASQMVAGNGAYSWGPTPEMVADIQGWLDDPALNFGWVVMGSEATPPPTAKRFVSREGADATLRPQLVVEFDPPIGGPPSVAAIPTLDTAGLIALIMVIGAAAGITLRRRRSY